MKAILVLDEMPEACGVCPLCQPDNERNMCYCGKTMADIKLAEKSDRCPLKSMPNRIDWLENGYNGGWIMFSTGWNACLQEIDKELLGETE